MTHAEYIGWLLYRKKWGPLGLVRRYDQPAALLASVMCRIKGNDKANPGDFLFYPAVDEEEDEITAVLREFGIRRNG